MNARAATLFKVDFKWNSEAAAEEEGECDKIEKHFYDKSQTMQCVIVMMVRGEMNAMFKRAQRIILK
jgi:hypothetical protein